MRTALALMLAASLHALALAALGSGGRSPSRPSEATRAPVAVTVLRPSQVGRAPMREAPHEARRTRPVSAPSPIERGRTADAGDDHAAVPGAAAKGGAVSTTGLAAHEGVGSLAVAATTAMGVGGGGGPAVAARGRGGAGSGGGGPEAGASFDALYRLLRERVAAHKRYPELARRRGIEGVVSLLVLVRADGTPEVAVVRGADPILDEAAREAVLAAAPLPRFASPVPLLVEFQLRDPEASDSSP